MIPSDRYEKDKSIRHNLGGHFFGSVVHDCVRGDHRDHGIRMWLVCLRAVMLSAVFVSSHGTDGIGILGRVAKLHRSKTLSLRGGMHASEESAEAQALRDMGLRASSSSDSVASDFANSLISGTLENAPDRNFSALLSTEQQSHDMETMTQLVTVHYYDLATGGTRNISQCYPEYPHITGFWQISVQVHGFEWTFCAHRGVCGQDEDYDSGYGEPMCSVGVGNTTVSRLELRSILLRLADKYRPEVFDAWETTSIDFAEDLVLELTSQRMPRRVAVPIPLFVEDDEMQMSDLASHNVSVHVAHFPPDLDREVASRVADMFRLWGKRLPTNMELGPQLEIIGPFLPSVANAYAEPPPGKLYVGMPAEDWLLQLRVRAEEASQQRMRGYLRAADRLRSPDTLPAAAELVARIRRQRDQP